jgi:hypothetical protein
MMDKLNNLWQIWMKIARVIGDFIGRLVLTVFYFTIFLPFGLGVRLFGDPLDLRRNKTAGWIERTTPEAKIDEAQRLF